jgi:hypothetical protein
MAKNKFDIYYIPISQSRIPNAQTSDFVEKVL